MRVCVLENHCLYSGEYEEDVLRDIVTDVPITINTAGQVQTQTGNFTMDPLWNAANMRVVAFIQRDSDKSVLQSCTSVPTGNYAFRYYSLGERVAVDSGSHEFGEFALFNRGDAADTYDLSLDTSALPGDWTAYFTDGVTNYTNLSVGLGPDARATYNVVIETGSTGGAGVTLNIHSQGDGTNRHVNYSVITSDVQVLLVDDDGGAAFESTYYGPALGTTGRSFAVWDRGSAALTGALLANFPVVVWNVGLAYPTLDDSDDRDSSAQLPRPAAASSS